MDGILVQELEGLNFCRWLICGADCSTRYTELGSCLRVLDFYSVGGKQCKQVKIRLYAFCRVIGCQNGEVVFGFLCVLNGQMLFCIQKGNINTALKHMGEEDLLCNIQDLKYSSCKVIFSWICFFGNFPQVRKCLM